MKKFLFHEVIVIFEIKNAFFMLNLVNFYKIQNFFNFFFLSFFLFLYSHFLNLYLSKLNFIKFIHFFLFVYLNFLTIHFYNQHILCKVYNIFTCNSFFFILPFLLIFLIPNLIHSYLFIHYSFPHLLKLTFFINKYTFIIILPLIIIFLAHISIRFSQIITLSYLLRILFNKFA
jgi:hypothetical protein